MNGPLRWLLATVSHFHEETVDVKTITFDVPGWGGHVAGQHVDIRLTAEDGYVGPLMLIAGGSGIAPLMSMLRTRGPASSRSPARLLYSSRSEQHIIYRGELDRLLSGTARISIQIASG